MHRACDDVLLALRTWVEPYFKRMGEEHERARAQLIQHLQREPTERELFEQLGIPCKD